MKRYVFDSSAILAFFFDRHGADEVEKILLESKGLEGALRISALQSGEICLSILRQNGRREAENFRNELRSLGFQIMPIEETTTYLAAEITNEFGLHFVDAVAAALAMQERAVLVVADRDFKRVEKRMKIRWVGV